VLAKYCKFVFSLSRPGGAGGFARGGFDFANWRTKPPAGGSAGNRVVGQIDPLPEIESAASQITVQGARYTEPSGSDFSAANLFMGVAVSRSRPSSPQCYRPSRNARTGSVRAARQAGKKQAANEAITSETDAMANGSGSRGLTL